MRRRHRQSVIGAAYGAFIAVFFVIMIFASAIARNHGISSCEDRGGTPVTRSWFSDSPWDVSCIRVAP